MLVFSGSNSNWLNNPDGAFAFYIRFTLLMPLQRIGIEAQVQVALELTNDGSYHATFLFNVKITGKQQQ